MYAVWKLISFVGWLVFSPFFFLIVICSLCLLGFGLFSVRGIFSLCELHYGEAAHSVTVQAPAPLFLEGENGCVPGKG